MKLAVLIAVLSPLLFWSDAHAGCTTQIVFIEGKEYVCVTCTVGGSTTTTCN